MSFIPHGRHLGTKEIPQSGHMSAYCSPWKKTLAKSGEISDFIYFLWWTNMSKSNETCSTFSSSLSVFWYLKFFLHENMETAGREHITERRTPGVAPKEMRVTRNGKAICFSPRKVTLPFYFIYVCFFFFFETESRSCCPGCSEMVESQLTANSASQVQAILLPQPPE